MNLRAPPTLFLPLSGALRARIEATIENLTALLDEIDGDPERELDSDDEDPVEEGDPMEDAEDDDL